MTITRHDDLLLARVTRHGHSPGADGAEPGDRRLPVGELQGLLALAAHASTAGIMITDSELDEPGPRVLYVNPAFEAITGYTAEQIVGLSPRMLQGPATDPRVLRRLRHDLESSGYFSGETVNYRADGSPFVMSWQVRALADADGRASHYVAIQSDVTADRLRDHHEREAARRLQREMLPRVPRRLGPLEVTARYVPVASDLAIGGDWYDAFQVGDRTVALVVGDVAGHGVSAAAAMGRLRWSVRSLLATGISITEVMGHVRAFASDEDLYATLAIALVDRSDHTIDIATIGHPPVLAWSERGVRQVSTSNPMLGIHSPIHAERRTRLAPDEILLLYTDGVLDGGRRDVSWLVDQLGEIDRDPRRSLDRVADELLQRVGTEVVSDDVAILLARPGVIDLTD